MSVAHFYTITIDDKEYRDTCPFCQWKKVEEHYNLSREHIKRGAVSGTPWLTDELFYQLQDKEEIL